MLWRPTTQIYDTPIRYWWPLRFILYGSISSLSPSSLHSKQQGDEGCRVACASPPRLELTQPPVPRVSRPYPTCPLRPASKVCAAIEVRARCHQRASCCRRAPRRQNLGVVAKLSARAAARELCVAGELYVAAIRAANELRTGNLRGIELRAGVELRVNEPQFAQAARR